MITFGQYIRQPYDTCLTLTQVPLFRCFGIWLSSTLSIPICHIIPSSNGMSSARSLLILRSSDLADSAEQFSAVRSSDARFHFFIFESRSGSVSDNGFFLRLRRFFEDFHLTPFSDFLRLFFAFRFADRPLCFPLRSSSGLGML